MSGATTRNLVILLTDIKGFTDRTSQQSRVEIKDLLDRHKEIVLPVLESRGGRLIKTIGDAFLMVFDSPTDAVLAGVGVQDALRAYNEDKAAELRIDIRIAINQGEVNLVDGDIFGEPVNITARIESVAEAGEVFFTEAVYLAMNKKEVPSSEVGLLQLKGVREKVRVYRVRRERPVGGAPSAPAALAPFWRRLLRVPRAEPAAKAHFTSRAGAPVSAARRAASLILDATLCGLLLSFITGDGRTLEIGYDTRKADNSSAPAPDILGEKITVEVKNAPLTTFLGVLSAQTSVDFVVADGLGEPGVTMFLNKVTLREALDGLAAATGTTYRRLGNSRTYSIERASPGAPSGDASVRYGDWKLGLRPFSRGYGFPVGFPLLWTLYGTFMLGAFGASIGQKVMRLKVVTVKTGAAPSWWHAFSRSCASVFSGYLLFLGYLWALWEKDRRCWHDLIADTMVVAAD